MTDTANTTSLVQMIAGYFACWNATDPVERQRSIDAVWAPDARSVDPMADVAGHEELAAMFAGFHDTYAGHSFRQRGGIDAHHQLVRWGWEMLSPEGTVVLDGLDVAVLDETGKISHLAGFFGADLPAAP